MQVAKWEGGVLEKKDYFCNFNFWIIIFVFYIIEEVILGINPFLYELSNSFIKVETQRAMIGDKKKFNIRQK